MNLKRAMWISLGIVFLCIAYIGVIVPGIPWSTPSVIAAYCFARSSDRMHSWIYNHPLFGPFLRGWQNKRIFPTKFKYFMIVSMCSSLAVMWFTTGNITVILWTGALMACVAIWGWRYPGSEEIYQQRVSAGKKIAWLS